MIDYLLVGAAFIIALAASYFLTPIMKFAAIKLNILSKPTKRSINTKPVPYLGGLAIYLSFIFTLLVVMLGGFRFIQGGFGKLVALMIAATLAVILGTWDDIKNIKPLTKLLGQIGIALILFINGFRVELLTNPLFGGEIHVPVILSLVVTVVWIVGLMNAMNLIDGLDGLAAGITSIISIALFFVALRLDNYASAFLLIVLAGSCLGFLKHNFYPAKIFMGDAGSMLLGLVLASSALIELQYKSATAVVLLIPITALAIPIYDVFMAVIRRSLKKKSIFKADKMHLHHRLLGMGIKHQHIVLLIYLITIYLGLFSFLFVLIPERYSLILLGLLALGFFVGIRVIGFVERKVRRLQRLELEKKRNA